MSAKQRRLSVAADLAEYRVDAFLVSSLHNIRYLTGFTGSSALLILEPSKATLLTDPRYDLQAHDQTDCKVKITRRPLYKAVIGILKRHRRTGFEPSQLNYETYGILKNEAKLKPLPKLVERRRMIKDPAEIDAIRKSVRINSQALDAALRRFKPNLSERDLAAEIDYQMKKLGAEGNSFETIVVSGPRSALPHARPGSAPILAGEVLLIDMGALYEGYASDMTRVVFPGTPGKKVKDLYNAVLDAQLAAIEAVRPGVKASAVDAAARESLKARGLDELFTHSTGHGLGLEIHEAPSLRRKDKTILEPGMAITIEPGVYEKGFGGIRIEDTVLVTANGCEILTPTPKQLLSI